MNQNQENLITQLHTANPVIETIPLQNPLMHNNFISVLPHLAVLKVSGNDASQFLQGQATCDIAALQESQSCFGAFCSVKGRTLTTFIALKQSAGFYLFLPTTLISSIKKRLQMYVLRSAVEIIEATDLHILGIISHKQNLNFPTEIFATTASPLVLKYPSTINRFLLLTDTQQALQVVSEYRQKHDFELIKHDLWSFLDISDGIPWLETDSCEQFIPQMLNLDQLDGISFNKGCYTGQEIIARTHYLGSSKRKMFHAECSTQHLPQTNSAILINDADTKKSVGHVVNAQCHDGICRMLVVLNIVDTDSGELYLDNPESSGLTVSQLAPLINK